MIEIDRKPIEAYEIGSDEEEKQGIDENKAMQQAMKNADFVFLDIFQMMSGADVIKAVFEKVMREEKAIYIHGSFEPYSMGEPSPVIVNTPVTEEFLRMRDEIRDIYYTGVCLRSPISPDKVREYAQMANDGYGTWVTAIKEFYHHGRKLTLISFDGS